ncbi:hypothetical protein J6590_089383 [Homalodisca vitripennis]|nr:hypothetical protein J6590_089383 [Homalodisca vitripennis]
MYVRISDAFDRVFANILVRLQIPGDKSVRAPDSRPKLNIHIDSTLPILTTSCKVPSDSGSEDDNFPVPIPISCLGSEMLKTQPQLAYGIALFCPSSWATGLYEDLIKQDKEESRYSTSARVTDRIPTYAISNSDSKPNVLDHSVIATLKSISGRALTHFGPRYVVVLHNLPKPALMAGGTRILRGGKFRGKTRKYNKATHQLNGRRDSALQSRYLLDRSTLTSHLIPHHLKGSGGARWRGRPPSLSVISQYLNHDCFALGGMGLGAIRLGAMKPHLTLSVEFRGGTILNQRQISLDNLACDLRSENNDRKCAWPSMRLASMALRLHRHL